jgi:SAM-dependent methyltransferase
MTAANRPSPRPPTPGLVPTLNNTGFMSEHLDMASQAFVDFAPACGGEALDMGCAFGVASLAALRKGARVLACDMEARHLEIVRGRAPEADRARLRIQPAVLPDADFPEGSFGAILCSRVVHFLVGADIERSVRKFHAWLKPGGKLFLVTDTPYSGYWKAHAPIYEANKRAGDPWPGFIADTSVYLPGGATRSAGFLNPCDPDILARVCAAAGFTVETARFVGRRASPEAPPAPDGTDHAITISARG